MRHWLVKYVLEAISDLVSHVTAEREALTAAYREDLKPIKEANVKLLAHVLALKAEIKDQHDRHEKALKEKDQQYHALLRQFLAVALQKESRSAPSTPVHQATQELINFGVFDDLPPGDPRGYTREELLIGGYQEPTHDRSQTEE
jgi:hypothetical protein